MNKTFEKIIQYVLTVITIVLLTILTFTINRTDNIQRDQREIDRIQDCKIEENNLQSSLQIKEVQVLLKSTNDNVVELQSDIKRIEGKIDNITTNQPVATSNNIQGYVVNK